MPTVDSTNTRRLAQVVAIAAGPAAATTAGATHSLSWLTVTLLAAGYELLLILGSVLQAVGVELKERWVERLTDAVDMQLQHLVSRYHRRYRRYIIASTSHLEAKGLRTRGVHTLRLDEVFIQLSLDQTATHHLNPDPVAKLGTNTDLPIWHWMRLAQQNKTILAAIGAPGCGKTTVLRHVSFMLAQSGLFRFGQNAPRRLPALVSLRDCQHLFAKSGSSPKLVDVIRIGMQAIPGIEPKNWVERQLGRNRFVVLLDGLDELPSEELRRLASEWVDQQRTAHPETLFVITSRPFGYKSNPLEVATVVQVAPFTESQISAFLYNWYFSIVERSFGEVSRASRLAAISGYDELLDKLRNTPALLALAVNPLLLTMIANVHYYRGALPGSRSDLYSEVCDVFSGTRAQARNIQLDMSGDQRIAILQRLAYEMMVHGSRDYSSEDAANAIRDTLRKVSFSSSPGDFLRRTEETSGLLLEREAGVYTFAHFTLQEFLAAKYARESLLEAELVDRAADPWWRETLRLFCAQGDGSAIISRCLREADNNAQNDQISTYQLILATQCESESRTVAPEVRKNLHSRLNPSSSDVHARLIAGKVSILLKADQYIRVGADAFMPPAAVTNVEYEAFLSSVAGRNAKPDHWPRPRCSDDDLHKPVTGVRPRDARTFSIWMRTIVTEGPRFRLPSDWEVRSYKSQLIDEDVVGFWSLGSPTFSDANGGPIDIMFTRDESVKLHLYGHQFTALSGRSSVTTSREVDVQADIERITKLFSTHGTTDVAVTVEMSSYLSEQASSGDLLDFLRSGVLLRALRKSEDALEISSLDMDFWYEFIVRSLQNWSEITYRSLSSAHSLGVLIDCLAAATREALNRRHSTRSSNETQVTIGTARVACLALYFEFHRLAHLGANTSESWGKRWRRRWSRVRTRLTRNEAERWFIVNTSEYSRICVDVLRVYNVLVELESRQQGRTCPWEGLILARGSAREELFLSVRLNDRYFRSVAKAVGGRPVLFDLHYQSIALSDKQKFSRIETVTLRGNPVLRVFVVALQPIFKVSGLRATLSYEDVPR